MVNRRAADLQEVLFSVPLVKKIDCASWKLWRSIFFIAFFP